MVMKYFLLVAVMISACASKKDSKEVFKSNDYVYVGEFTQGLEGPAVDLDDNLYFVNPKKNGTIGKVGAITQKLEIFIDSLPNGSIANGIRIGNDGILYAADYVNHNVLMINSETKEVSIFASDSAMNQPNDIAISLSKILFASDPDWTSETGNIWRIDSSGKVSLLESDMGTTNGIEVAPGDSILYVNESVQRKIWRYNLDSNGNISNKKLLIQFKDHGLDGMRCDVKGNLYIARYGKGVIAMVSPQGELIKEIELRGKKPTNITFGGKDGKTVYVTCQDRGYIEMFRAEFAGRSFSMHRK